jgi:hypothetical protein
VDVAGQSPEQQRVHKMTLNLHAHRFAGGSWRSIRWSFFGVWLVAVLYSLTTSLHADTIGDQLQQNVIWTGEVSVATNHFRAFRKSFTLAEPPASAVLHVFADNRYLLWVNGQYVQQGPMRFDPKGPNYDSIDIATYLQSGSNVIALQVMAFRNGESGRAIRHVPGLTARLAVNGATELVTDTSWRWSAQTQFKGITVTWGFNLFANDGRNEPVGWATVSFEDSAWSHAYSIAGNQWGALRASFIPPLTKTEVVTWPPSGQSWPITLNQGQSVVVDLGRQVQGYEVVDLEAAAGAVLRIRHGQTAGAGSDYGSVNSYTAKAGRQIFFPADSYGHRYVKLTAQTDVITLHAVKVVDRRYPYEETGRFKSSDTFLNELWNRGRLTLQVCAEDGYEDESLRERAEWLGDSAVVEYPCTRVAFGVRDTPTGVPKSDAGLMKQMIRHIAQSQQPDGRLKAHAVSDRFDIHGYIEDYSCLWVQSLREVYDKTGDLALLQEVWPKLVTQMQWFLDRRTSRGLVNAREFVIFDNPQIYNVCEGATLNAFVYKALRDSSYLASELGQTQQAQDYAAAGDALFTAFNQYLWNDKAGNYNAGLDNPNDLPAANPTALPPTVHSAILPLQSGIVPTNRMDRVRNYLFSNWSSVLGFGYTHWWLLGEFYKADSQQQDVAALDSIRSKWAGVMQITDTGTLRESYNGGGYVHNFGASPIYYLGAYVLGVRLDGKLSDNRILIEPRLGDLEFANGVVVTEHGPVPVSWNQGGDGQLTFEFSVPTGIVATVHFPKNSFTPTLILNGQVLVDHGVSTHGVSVNERWIMMEVPSGNHTGTVTMAPAILVQPVGGGCSIGGTFTLSVVARGAVYYQWQKNSNNIPGATSSALTLSNVTVLDGGDYRVTVSNAWGTVTSSNTAVMTVESALQLNSIFISGDSLPSFPCATNDLLQTSLSSVNPSASGNNFTGVPMRNGTTGTAFQGGGGTGQNPANIMNGGTYDFLLNTNANPNGYDLTSIIAYSGWMDDRAGQDHSLWYQPVGGDSFISIINVTIAASAGALRTVVNRSSGPIATGVGAIRVLLNQSYFVYRELDVFGVPTVRLAPTLQIAQQGSGALKLYWMASAHGFTMTATPVLGAVASWQVVTNTPVLTNGYNQVTLPAIGSKFFRLEK